MNQKPQTPAFSTSPASPGTGQYLASQSQTQQNPVSSEKRPVPPTPGQTPPVSKTGKRPGLSLSPGLLIPIAVIALLGLNFVAWLLLTNASRESQVAMSHLEAVRRNQQNVAKLEVDLQTYSGKISQITGVLPKEKDIPNFIQFMTDAASQAGSTLSLNFTSNQPIPSKEKLSVIPLSLQMTSTNDQLSQFLTVVHAGKYQIRFEHLETETLQAQELNIRLSGKLYVDAQFAAP